MIITLVFLFPINLLSQANETIEMSQLLRADGKIYVVLAVISIVLAGLFGYLIYLDKKISKLEETLSNARIIDESKLDTSKVLVLSTVKIKNLNNSATMEYKLVAQSEADLAKGKISVDSPIGKGLLGKKVGDTAEISIPNGNVKFEILEISR